MPRHTTSLSGLFVKSTADLLKHLKAAKTLDEEKIHALRVDIKQIKALLELLKKLGYKTKRLKKLISLISPVFKAAGEIRTVSVNLQLIEGERSDAFREFRRHLETKKKASGKQLRRALKEFDVPRFKQQRRHISEKIESVSKEKTVREAQSHVAALSLELRRRPQNQGSAMLHDTRKTLKRIKTLTKLLIRLSSSRARKQELAAITRLEEVIGQWHDHVVLAGDLGEFLASQNSSEKPRVLDLYLKKLGRNNSAAKKKVLNQLHKMLRM